MEILIMPLTASDWPEVARIYQEGIDTGSASFELRPPDTWEAWQHGKISACNLGARQGGTLAGWAVLSSYSTRAVYSGVAEVSIYIRATSRGQGVGRLLLQSLIEVSEANGIWTLQSGIFPENLASLNLHARHGFRQVGVREKLGRMEFGPFEGQWRDVVLLERRSRRVGIT